MIAWDFYHCYNCRLYLYFFNFQSRSNCNRTLESQIVLTLLQILLSITSGKAKLSKTKIFDVYGMLLL